MDSEIYNWNLILYARYNFKHKFHEINISINDWNITVWIIPVKVFDLDSMHKLYLNTRERRDTKYIKM